MSNRKLPIAVVAAEVPPRTRPSLYPEPFASRMAGREKRALGDVFALSRFGVNLTRLAPGAMSALRHAHSKQDELIYVLEGHPTLRTDEGATPLGPGMCAGFKAGTGNGHHLVNETADVVVYLEVGDRTPDDEASYPDDDLRAVLDSGRWRFLHKDGAPYGADATSPPGVPRLRAATPADREFLRELYGRADGGVGGAQLRGGDEAHEATTYSVVELDGVRVGATAIDERAEHIELVELQILPQWQNRGVGSRVIESQLAHARQLQKPLRVLVSLDSRARSLFERHGFRAVAQTPTHHVMQSQPG